MAGANQKPSHLFDRFLRCRQPDSLQRPLVDGQAGVFAKGTAAKFDSYQLKTDDGNAGTTNTSNPTAGADSVNGVEDTALFISNAFLTGNDTDPNGLSLTVTGVSQPANGTLAATAGGWTFTPAANFNGTTSFTYTISNGQGGVGELVEDVRGDGGAEVGGS
jgi:hypothetical protein